jgi:hypothetical protein
MATAGRWSLIVDGQHTVETALTINIDVSNGVDGTCKRSGAADRLDGAPLRTP